MVKEYRASGMRYLGLLVMAAISVTAFAADWPQWGRTNCRNMVCGEQNLPDSFVPGERSRDGRQIKLETTENVRWAVRVGTNIHGNPVVADGRVFVGTNAATLKDDPRFHYDKGGIVKCLDADNGKLLWQLAIPVRTSGLPKNHNFKHQHLGVCSSCTVEGDRAYTVTSAGDVVCLDIHGQANGNDGPFQGEAQYMAGPDNPPIGLGEKDADIIWRYDPVKELDVCPHDAASCSPLIQGDMLYVGTSNGVDEPHEKVISPLAPSLIVLDKNTGRLVAMDNERIGTRLYHGLWSSPAMGEVGNQTLIIYGAGDGVCYAFRPISEAKDEPVHLEKVWSYDCNPPEYKYRDGKPIAYYAGDKRKKDSPNNNDGQYVGPSQIIATPVFHKGRVYVAIGQDPAHGRGKGVLHCIDASKKGDVTEEGRVWTYKGIERSISTVAVSEGLLYVPDIAGKLHCLDADTGRCYWVYDTKAETWGSVLVADGKLYLGNKQRFYVFAAGKEPRLLSEIRLGPTAAYTSPIAANGVLYVASQRYVWAVQAGLKRPHVAAPDG